MLKKEEKKKKKKKKNQKSSPITLPIDGDNLYGMDYF